MTITSTTVSVTYAGDDSSTNFAVPFAFYGLDEITVRLRDAAGALTLLTRGVQYNVTGGAGATGTVVATAAPSAGTYWVIRRQTARTQQVVYADYDPFPAPTHELAIDRLTAQSQETDESVGRSLRGPIGDGAVDALPMATTRAGKYLMFDGGGQPTVGVPSGTGAPISAGMTPVVAAATPGVALLLLLGGLSTATVSAATGSTRSASGSDGNKMIRRSNSGTLMVDTLPGSGMGIMAAGWMTYLNNSDTTAMLVVQVGSGATLDGGTGYIYIGPGQTVGFLSDGTKYFSMGADARARCGAALTIYVATTGSDNNHGLSAAAPVLTPKKAVALLYQRFDHNGFAPTIRIADGTYTAGTEGHIYVLGCPVGIGYFYIVGNTTTWANVVLTATGSTVVNAGGGVNVFINGAKVTATGTTTSTVAAGQAFTAYGGANILFGQIDFGACNVCHMSATQAGACNSLGQAYKITAGSVEHVAASQLGLIITTGSTVTLVGTPGFSFFGYIGSNSTWDAKTMTFVGSATGYRFGMANNATIETGSSGTTTYFPGNAYAAPPSGCQYS